MKRFIPEKRVSFNGGAGDGELETCRKMGGKYWREECEVERERERERRVTGMRGGYEGENGGGKRTRVSFGLGCVF